MGAGVGANTCDLALLPSLLWVLASPLGSECSGPPGGMLFTHPTLCWQNSAHRCGLCLGRSGSLIPPRFPQWLQRELQTDSAHVGGVACTWHENS